MLKKNIFIFFIALIIFSCTSNEDLVDPIQHEEGNVSFNLTNMLSKLQKVGEIDSVSAVVATIVDGEGNTIYAKETIDLLNFNGKYISNPISLAGNNTYYLSEFFVLDLNNEIKYVTPKESSKLSYLVKNPLNIEFSVNPNSTTHIVPEIVSISNAEPEDFGYVTFGLNYIESLNILLQAFTYNSETSQLEPTIAKISAFINDEEIYTDTLEESVNLIPLIDTLETYTLKIVKYNYYEYVQLFSKTELLEYTTKPLTVILNERESNVMVTVEGGTFVMGDNIRPTAHTVTLTNNYEVGKFVVSNREYCNMLNYANSLGEIEISGGIVYNTEGTKKSLINLNDSWTLISYNNNLFTVDEGKEDYPAYKISWYGAVFYCNICSKKEGLNELYDISEWSCSSFYSSTGYRLPTEAEWEFAAIGGNQSQGYLYSGSNDPNEVAWYSGNSGIELHEIGLKAPNELGIYDMSGNCWEIINDWYNGNYSGNAETNPTGSASGTSKLVRGGTRVHDASGVQAKSRSFFDRNDKAFAFRIVKVL